MDYSILEQFHNKEVGLRLSDGSSLVGRIFTPSYQNEITGPFSFRQKAHQTFTMDGIIYEHCLERAIDEYKRRNANKEITISTHQYSVDSEHVTCFREVCM